MGMSEMIHTFLIPGKRQGHPGDLRAVTRGGKTHLYRTGESRGWMASVAIQARTSGLPTDIDGPIVLDVIIRHALPIRTCFSSGEPHWKRPDTSNTLKLLEDALRNHFDDAQIAITTIRKEYALQSEIEVTLTWGDDFRSRWDSA